MYKYRCFFLIKLNRTKAKTYCRGVSSCKTKKHLDNKWTI
nr:MAG TPA: hypothetical protein [Caudoviricetes sp.]